MKRRTFINYIGSAIIGTAIALRLPDGLVPLNHLTERPRITFKAMMDAYNKAKESGEEPCILLLSKATMVDAHDQVRAQARFTDGQRYDPRRYDAPYFNFIDTTVADWPELPDDVIQVHSRNGVIKEYHFV